MRKLLRLLFSRFTIMLVAILLQVSIAVVLTFSFSYNYKIFTVVSVMLTVIVLLLIINRDMDCEAKLPWAILTAIVPIVGFFAYICFSRTYASRKERKIFARLPQIKLADEYPKAPTKYLGQLNYLKSTGAPCFSNTGTEYFCCGEDFFADLTTELNKAQKFIFMEYFIVEHGKMLDTVLEILEKKASQGVEVRFLYDDLGSLPHIKGNLCKQLQKAGINCARFAPLRPIVSAIYNNRDHRKITVIDGKTGYVGGINLADEYINQTHPFGYWKDSAVKLEGSAVASLVTMFLKMFDTAVQKTEDFEKYLIPTDKNRFVGKGEVVPFGDGPRPLYNEQIAKTVYLNLINQAVRDLYITTPYLIADDGFMSAISNAAKRGVDVNIIIPAIPDKKSVYAMTKQSCGKLARSGVKIHKFSAGFVHAKSIVADGAAGVVGTINVDYRSFVHHYECGVYMYDTDALHELYNDMLVTVQNCEPQPDAPELKLWERLVCIFGALFRPLL